MRLTTLATLVAVAGFSLSNAAYAAEPDVANGESVFNKCRACHAVGAGAKNKIGPVQNGIVGRKAATVPGFNYSPAMKAAAEKGLIWTEANLDKYIENPRAFMPGNRMAFAGVKDPLDRKDLIAYLATKK